MILKTSLSSTFTPENNTYEVDDGYIFSNKKKGNFYEISDIRKDSVSKYSYDFGGAISITSLTLDTESKHYESKVNHFMDAIGTIGGIFEILLMMISLVYSKIRKNLYYQSIINELNRQKQEDDDRSSIKINESSHQARSTNFRDDPRRIYYENRRLLNNRRNFEVNNHSNN